MRKAIFLDRDGTVIVEPPVDKQVDSIDKLEFIPGAITALSKIAKSGTYDLVMVTNQDGLGTASFPEETFWPAHNLMLSVLKGEGVVFDDVIIDRTLPAENASTRKPGTKLVERYMNGSYDLKNSFVVGDRTTDIEFAKNLGAKAIFFSKAKDSRAMLSTTNWGSIATFINSVPRFVTETRKTSETEIKVELNLDGEGFSQINTGLGFFDHMLEQIAKHGGLDLVVQTNGDLHIDEHHTIEDTAIVLGAALKQALGNKIGIERYAFVLPMDECKAEVTLDFSGRSYLVWDAEFQREKIGEMPTEMFKHFFKSLSDEAKLTLNIKATGENEHHKIECIFKAFARALKDAVRRSSDELPSTKGVL